MNISKIKTLIPAPESNFHIELSNDNSQVNCDYNGSPIAGAVYEPSVISLWYGGSDAWSQFNVTVAASGISHGYNATLHSLNPSNITLDTATITVTARHKTRTNVVLQATYTLTKNKAGSPGATPVSRSLKPSLHVIRKSNDGSFLDTQLSFEVHIRRGTELTVVSTLGDLYANALDIKIGDEYIGDGSKGNQPISVATADFWTNNDAQVIRLEHEIDTEICYDTESIGVVTDGDDGLTAASGLFIPAIIWVEADEDGWSVGNQSFNVTPSVLVEGVPCGFEDPLTILSSPAAVTATYDSSLGLIVISVPDGTDPVEYEGEVKVRMEAIVSGNIYPVTKDIPIVAKKKGSQGEPGKDGEDGVTYEIIPSVSSIRADENGSILTGYISVSAYRTKKGVRSSCGVGLAVAIGTNGEEVNHYWVQYSVNGGSWTNCSNISTGSGIHMVLDYGVPGSAVSTITSGIAFRLLYGTSSSYSVVHQIAPLQVVKNGQTGQRGKTGRYYYYDGYFESTKEYTATDNQAPYVAFDWEDTVTVNDVDTQVTKTSYYMLVAETNKPSGTYIAPRTEAATGVWELMETSFKFLIAQAFFTEFGKLGSAVFSGDWMISQHGTPGRAMSSSEKNVLKGVVETKNVSLSTLAGLKNTDGSYKTTNSVYTSLRSTYSDAQLQTAIDHAVWAVENGATHEQLQAMSTTSYQLFGADQDNPFKLFTPNYAVDFLAGQAYLEDASLRGVLKVRALYTVEGSVKTVSGKFEIDLEDSPGNSYVLPGDSTVYLPDPTKYAGLSLTILFSGNSVLAYEDGMYMAYYTGTTTVIQNGMSFKAVHSVEGLSVLTLQSIKAYGPNSGVKWVVVGQRGILGVRSLIDGPDAYQVLPDGRLLTNS